MGVVQVKLTRTFKEVFDDQKSSGIILIVCTIVSLVITNSPIGENYLKLWHFYVAGLSVEHWINDGLMAIFFLLIGLELERELYITAGTIGFLWLKLLGKPTTHDTDADTMDYDMTEV
ncbi:MAG TPA: Na+/H+ antiporter NhaA [Pyrinomonadaceae bacterium]|nr:Na+/H+ antiporter NhaA [Pyrinomonadaceae bacterium]